MPINCYIQNDDNDDRFAQVTDRNTLPPSVLAAVLVGHANPVAVQVQPNGDGKYNVDVLAIDPNDNTRTKPFNNNVDFPATAVRINLFGV